MLARALQKPFLGWNASCFSLFLFLENFCMLFSVCFLMEALYTVKLHVNSIGRVSLQLKTGDQYSVATEVLKADTTICVDSDL